MERVGGQVGGRLDALGTVDKAVDVLFRLSAEPSPQGVSDLGRALGLPKSSVHRLLASLARRGLVERDERGRYRPGIALLALGLGALEREPLAAAARPLLEAETRALGETAFLVVARAGRLLVLEKAEGAGFLRAAPRVGAEVPVHATAVGKLFLAHAPDRVSAPAPPLERFTPRTPRSADELARAVRRARERGYAESREEWIPGMSVVAAPVLAGGRMHGAIAVAAPTPRLAALGRAEVARRVSAVAASLAAKLEGRQA
jgi:DNA-binding IclR family transcriptional regulator